jgi:hypothetical protein
MSGCGEYWTFIDIRRKIKTPPLFSEKVFRIKNFLFVTIFSEESFWEGEEMDEKYRYS